VISRGILSNTPSWPKKLPTVLIAAFGMFILVTGFLLTGQLMSGGGNASVVSTETVEASSSETPVVDSPAAGPPAVAPAGGPLADVVAKTAASRVTATAAPSDAPGRAHETAAPVARPSAGIIGKRTGVPIDAVEGLALALSGAGESGRRIAMVGARRNMGTTLAAISLARALGRQGRTIMVDLALESPNLSVIASDANVPGISELVAGAASFGQVITRDRYSNVHLITLGKVRADGAILSSPRLAITLEALNRSYDYVVVDAGALPEIAADKIAKLAPRAVLVADEIDGPTTESARERLLSAGFPNVSVLASAPQGPESDAAGGTRVAA
jgi:Mrp family chromosome partitioning ATPase